MSLLIAASHRLTHFGEDHCRLSFGQSTLEIQDSKWGLLLAIISNTLLFGFPDARRARFKNLWVDQLVNTSRWRGHVSGTVEDLKQTVSSVSRIAPAIGTFTDLFLQDVGTSHVRKLPLPGKDPVNILLYAVRTFI